MVFSVLGRACALTLTLTIGVLGVAAPSSAQTDDRFDGEVPPAGTAIDAEPAELTLADLLPDSQLYHPDVLAQVMPASARVEQLRAELSTAMLDAADAEDRRLDASLRRSEAQRDGWAQRVVLADRLDDEEAAEEIADDEFDRLGVFALDNFLGSEEIDLARLTVDGAMSPLPEYADSAAEIVEQRYAAARADLARARQAVVDAENGAAEIARRQEAAEADLDSATSDLEDADVRVADLRPQLEQALIGETVRGTDMSLVVIDAYFRAQISMSERRPTCGISWDQLAGVGLIESRHGSYGGSSVGPDGQTTDEILGPVLNGDPFAAIADTDGGAMDGNTEWDRAVGPMQFIPSSWQIYGLDGNGDGVADPHNLYDAAFAAAEHLCRGYANIQNENVYRSALLGYNRSAVYGEDVMAAQRRYAEAVQLVPTADGLAEDLARRNGDAAAIVGAG